MYYCDICHKTFSQKNDIRRHLNRKKPCGNGTSNITIEYVKEKYGLIKKNKKNLFCENDLQKTENDLQKTENDLQKTFNNLDISKKKYINKSSSSSSSDDDKYRCEYCNKKFTRVNNKNVHIKKYCKVYKMKRLELSKKEETVQSLINSNNVTNNVINNVTNNITNNTQNITNNTQNITQNITINCLGKEDTSYISNDFLKHVVENPVKGLVKLVELIHFNPEHPENANIKMHNKKDKYLDTLVNNDWKFVDKKKMIDYLISSKKEITDNFIDAAPDLDKNTMQAYDNYSEAIDYYIYKFILNSNYPPSKKSYKKIYKQLFDDIILMIVNHKRIVTHMHQNMML